MIWEKRRVRIKFEALDLDTKAMAAKVSRMIIFGILNRLKKI